MDAQIAEFIETVKDAGKFSAKIDQLVAATEAHQKAKADADAASLRLRNQKSETDAYVNGRKAELAAAQKLHDEAAKEVADRIEVGRNQIAEVLRVRTENEAAAKAVAAKEASLVQREKLVKDAELGLAARAAEIQRKAEYADRVIAHINATPKQ